MKIKFVTNEYTGEIGRVLIEKEDDSCVTFHDGKVLEINRESRQFFNSYQEARHCLLCGSKKRIDKAMNLLDREKNIYNKISIGKEEDIK